MSDGPRLGRRDLLIASTAIAVVTDAVLIPFYPRLFAEAFAVDDPRHVGVYLAATCVIVMLVLPLWARLERRWSAPELLCVGQLGAGSLALASSLMTDLRWFWACSLTMIVFKASYLLVYPYLMRHEPKARRANTIGLLTVIVHLGGIVGATIGGWVLEHHDPRRAFWVMAAGDFVMMGVSLDLVRRLRVSAARPPAAGPPDRAKPTANADASQAELGAGPRRLPALVELGGLMALVYLSVFILRPFFVEYWGTRSVWSSDLISGWVFAVPAFASLAALAAQHRGWTRPRSLATLLATMALGALGQAAPWPAMILVARFVCGWATFRAFVELDTRLFEISPPARYAEDFSRMNLCQQGGVLIAFWTAGAAVSLGGLAQPIYIAAFGLFVSAMWTGARRARALEVPR